MIGTPRFPIWERRSRCDAVVSAAAWFPDALFGPERASHGYWRIAPQSCPMIWALAECRLTRDGKPWFRPDPLSKREGMKARYANCTLTRVECNDHRTLCRRDTPPPPPSFPFHGCCVLPGLVTVDFNHPLSDCAVRLEVLVVETQAA